ncbi:PAS domain S-box protein [Hahella sp. KA22]|uniref:PAS domain-containing sensor histidine kinase n=1 Tax=Hahella sp. KA22 TaxID=1628392 RepID=UPI000FDEFE3A|nr:PAS domain S-box protein [Hahella sp. KA22]AZZ94880.1 PAS domain S-box protein [Hahella sp. KA22]QAY58253.1 PAS domain S-box protein [Hahella sp. KA22]
MKLKSPLRSINKSLKNYAVHLFHSETPKSFAPDDEPGDESTLQRLVHELQVHQIELETQNEELRHTQLQLSNARDQYLQLYDMAPIAYVTIDQTGKILDANFKASELFDARRNELPGAALAAFISPASQDAYYLHRQAVFSTGLKQATELTLKGRPTQTVTRVESVTSADKDRCLMVMVDITSQKLAEEALKRLNEELETLVAERMRQIQMSFNRLNTILNTATDAIITINNQGEIESVNPASAEMFGFSSDELIGGNISLVIPTQQTETLLRNINQLLHQIDNRPTGCVMDISARRKGGYLFPISLSSNRIDKENAFTCIIRDMSERVELEKVLLQRTEEERNRIGRELHDTIGQTVVGIALKAISLSTELEKIAPPLAQALADMSAKLETTGREIHTIVNDLSPLRMDDNDFKEALQWLVDSSQIYSHAKITLECPNDVAIKDSRVATQLYRIAQEALHNAIKHAKAELIQVKIKQTSEFIKLSVIDDGSGMESTSRSARLPFSLSGKGLENMKYRAHVIGADVEVLSNKGKGSHVECTLLT